jgi:hypothetical protein
MPKLCHSSLEGARRPPPSPLHSSSCACHSLIWQVVATGVVFPGAGKWIASTQ